MKPATDPRAAIQIQAIKEQAVKQKIRSLEHLPGTMNGTDCLTKPKKETDNEFGILKRWMLGKMTWIDNVPMPEKVQKEAQPLKSERSAPSRRATQKRVE
ncbi:MAG: hypothetical protein HRU26_07490 [Psychroserpens sp.]|nr:hypothetical protein [Psychroserpens sp.]